MSSFLIPAFGLLLAAVVLAAGAWCYLFLPNRMLSKLSTKEKRRLKTIERFTMTNEIRRTILQTITALVFTTTCFFAYLSAKSASESISTAQGAIRSQAESARETTKANATSAKALRQYELRLDGLRRYRASTVKSNTLAVRALVLKLEIDRLRKMPPNNANDLAQINKQFREVQMLQVEWIAEQSIEAKNLSLLLGTPIPDTGEVNLEVMGDTFRLEDPNAVAEALSAMSRGLGMTIERIIDLNKKWPSVLKEASARIGSDISSFDAK